MRYSMILVGLLTVLGLSACDRPTVVNTPSTPVPVVVPGAPGPAGPAGPPGYEGKKGDPGKPGGDAVIVVPVPAEQK